VTLTFTTNRFGFPARLIRSCPTLAPRLTDLQTAADGSELADLDGHSITIGDRLPRIRRHARAGKDDADEVQRVGGADQHDFTARRLTAGGAQRLDGLRERELFADQPFDETPPADFASGFEAAQHGQQVSPGWGVALAVAELANEQAVATQQEAGAPFDGVAGRRARGDAGAQQGPPSDRH
jgi:hypothetical protein